jgi:hypothetical protein
MYFGITPTSLWSGGTESAGVTALSTHWFLAEGATGGFFDTFILVSNPNAAMYWLGAAQPWGEGHNSFGVVDAGLHWGLAEGRVGGPYNFHTYILLANPQSASANLTIRFLREGTTPSVKTFTVPRRRASPSIARPITELHNESFGADISVTNAVPIIVEESLYWDSNGFQFSGGTNATDVPLP